MNPTTIVETIKLRFHFAEKDKYSFILFQFNGKEFKFLVMSFVTRQNLGIAQFSSIPLFRINMSVYQTQQKTHHENLKFFGIVNALPIFPSGSWKQYRKRKKRRKT